MPFRVEGWGEGIEKEINHLLPLIPAFSPKGEKG